MRSKHLNHNSWFPFLGGVWDKADSFKKGESCRRLEGCPLKSFVHTLHAMYNEHDCDESCRNKRRMRNAMRLALYCEQFRMSAYYAGY